MRFDCDFDAAIFDMDGTLLDTMPYWRFTTLEFLLAHQLPIRDDALLRMYGTSSRKLLMEIAQRENVEMDRVAMIHEIEGYMHRHYLYDAHLKTPSVPAFLRHLRDHGVRMCVATGSPREYARDGLERLGILEYFDFVTDNYEGPFTKDQPEYFHWLMDRLGVAADRCWVFEDAVYAMRAAKAAGIRVCAIEDDTQASDRDAIRALADQYILDYDELM